MATWRGRLGRYVVDVGKRFSRPYRLHSEPVVSSYIVASTPRTGSSLLCSLLEKSGYAGRPIEYFNPGRFSDLSTRWAADGIEQYAARLVTTATPNGVFGTKLHWHEVGPLLAQARTVPAWLDLTDRELIETLFPNVRYIWIRRRDKLRQAISWWLARNTGQWDRRPGGRTLHFEGPLDLDAVNKRIEQGLVEEENWANFFASTGVEPLVLYYEDLLRHTHDVVNAVLIFLGVHPGRSVPVARPAMERQAGPFTEAWVVQYLAAVEAGTVISPSGFVTHDPRSFDRDWGPRTG